MTDLPTSSEDNLSPRVDTPGISREDAYANPEHSAQLAGDQLSQPASPNTGSASLIHPEATAGTQHDVPHGSTEFAPFDIRDGRRRYEWESKYPTAAQKEIEGEKKYLFVLLYGIPVLMTLIWSRLIWGDMNLAPERYQVLARFSYAWLGGMLGGTVFDLKWLYHSIAKGMWHLDRQLWRTFTPHISGALAFGVILLIKSDIFKLFNQSTFNSSGPIVAVSFLVGYFSDSAIAKLTELADTLFGTTHKRNDDSNTHD